MRRLVLLSVALPGLAISAPADTYVVHPDGTGDFPTIQAAIDFASDGDIVELTDGTFTGDGNRDIDFLGKAVTVRSQGGDPELVVFQLYPPHCRGFLFQSSEGPESVLESITLRGGHYHAEYAGAAVYCGPGSAPTVTNCVLEHNGTEGNGGALACRGASPSITECVFYANHAFHDGGGIYCGEGSYPTVSDCVFRSNGARFEGYGASGGAIYSTSDSHVIVSNCFFAINYTEGSGGAISAASGVITDCDFVTNSAESHGGAVAGGNLTISGCVFLTNLTDFWGGALDLSGQGRSEVVNCTFLGNEAGYTGSGIFCIHGAMVTLANSIIAFGNDGDQPIDCWQEATADLTCCNVYGNEAGDWVGCIEDQYGINGNISEDPLFCGPYQDLTLQDCSPCAPFTPPNPECDLIGARPVGCEGTPTTRSTWGAVKALFR